VDLRLADLLRETSDSAPEPPPAEPARVAVDETAVQVGTEWYWVYAAVDLDSLSLLDVAETEFLTDAYGYRTALSRSGLSGQVEYSDRNHVEKWFHTFKMRTGRFHSCWVGSRPAVAEWCQQFRW